MNYIVVYKQNKEPKMEFFKYRDETDVAYKQSTLIRDEDDVIDIMLKYYQPDDNNFVIRETLLDVADLSDDKLLEVLTNALNYLNG